MQHFPVIFLYLWFFSSFPLSSNQIMVCHCKPPPDGGLGCGEECLNRVLNIECVKGTCPCGDICSNQQVASYTFSLFYVFVCVVLLVYSRIFLPSSKSVNMANSNGSNAGRKGTGCSWKRLLRKDSFSLNMLGRWVFCHL